MCIVLLGRCLAFRMTWSREGPARHSGGGSHRRAGDSDWKIVFLPPPIGFQSPSILETQMFFGDNPDVIDVPQGSVWAEMP